MSIGCVDPVGITGLGVMGIAGPSYIYFDRPNQISNRYQLRTQRRARSYRAPPQPTPTRVPRNNRQSFQARCARIRNIKCVRS